MLTAAAVLKGGPPGQKHILVVDDEADIRDSLVVLFESEFPGIKVHAVASGHEALAFLETRPVDLVISDYKMPGMNGLELLNEVMQRSPLVKRALITAYPDALMVLGKDTPRLSFFMAKPIDLENIIEQTQRTLEGT